MLAILLTSLRPMRSSAIKLSQNTGYHSSTLCSAPITFFYNDVYDVQLPDNHKFPMHKYRYIRESLQREYAESPFVHFQVSPLATREELISTHCPYYVQRFISGDMNVSENRRVGFPWSLAGVQRSTSSVGGTVEAMRSVLMSFGEPNSPRASGHIAGGTHHAFFDHGEGFCVFSDIAVAANLAITEYQKVVKKILIVDLDVHQGNGNAALFSSADNVFTFSMHCKENLFSAKQSSDVDVELQKGCSDEEYLRTLQEWLPYLFDFVKPQLVFYQAGVDIHERDRLGKLSISREGISRRNQLVYEESMRRNAKVVVVMGGGYPTDMNPESSAFQEIMEAHLDVYRDCIRYCT